MNKKEYVIPETEITEFETEDIITGSTNPPELPEESIE